VSEYNSLTLRPSHLKVTSKGEIRLLTLLRSFPRTGLAAVQLALNFKLFLACVVRIVTTIVYLTWRFLREIFVLTVRLLKVPLLFLCGCVLVVQQVGTGRIIDPEA
jgi:hypothetical protein